MTEQNYYVAYYQAVIEKNASKAVKLNILSDKEQEEYPNEYPNLSYDDIFSDQDADDVIESLLTSEKYREFFLEFLAESKTIAGNYYIAFYQTIIEQNVIKVKILEDLSFKEIANYPNEYPEINYDDIFQDQLPYYVILRTIKNDDDLHSLVEDITNPLATEETIAQREENFKELMKHPLIDYRPNPKLGLSITDNLASVTYSTTFNQHALHYSIIPLINNSLILAELFSSIAISTIIESKNPFSIALVGNNIDEYDPTSSSSTGGYHHSIKNTLVVTSINNQINSPFLAHELSHKLMYLLFSHDDPYHEHDEKNKSKYHQTIREVLINIKQFVEREFNLNISIKDDDSTWDIGQKLCAILFPEYIDKNETLLKEVISILENNNIGINDPISWLSNDSFLENATSTLNFDLANLMLKNGFKLSHNILIEAVNSNVSEIIDWYLTQDNIDLNFKNQFGDNALDYADCFSLPEIVKTLFAAGANPYSSNHYEQICTINPSFKEFEDLSPTLEKQLQAIKIFLMLYLQYESSEEDCEFIVRLPQIIAEDLYHGEVVDIFAPIAEYWEDVITPEILEYQTQNDPSDICLTLTYDYIY